MHFTGLFLAGTTLLSQCSRSAAASIPATANTISLAPRGPDVKDVGEYGLERKKWTPLTIDRPLEDYVKDAEKMFDGWLVTKKGETDPEKALLRYGVDKDRKTYVSQDAWLKEEDGTRKTEMTYTQMFPSNWMEATGTKDLKDLKFFVGMFMGQIDQRSAAKKVYEKAGKSEEDFKKDDVLELKKGDDAWEMVLGEHPTVKRLNGIVGEYKELFDEAEIKKVTLIPQSRGSYHHMVIELDD